MEASINLVDASFNKDRLNTYQLNVQVHEHNITVCITEPKQQVAVALWSLDTKYPIFEDLELLDKLLHNCSIPLKGAYQSTTVAIGHKQYSFVPSPLFDAKKIQSYVELNCGHQTDSQFKYDNIDQENMHLAFSVSNSIIKSLDVFLGEYSVIHHQKVFLNSITGDFKSTDLELYVNYKRNQLELLYFKTGKFHHGNSYEIGAPEDFLFYILNSCQQLQLNPQKLKLVLFGNIKTGDEIHHLAFSYFEKIQFGVVGKNPSVAPELNDQPKHIFYTAYKQFLCE